jgi:signal peptidase II
MARLVLISLAALTVAIDQGTKLWAVSMLSDGEIIDVIGNLIQFRLTYNPGAAFSFGAGFTWLFTLAAAAMVLVVGGISRRVASYWWTMPLGLILGGATTHLLDRLLREPAPASGHVVDFIDYSGLFVGNVADIALVAGFLWAALLHLRGVKLAQAPVSQPPPALPDSRR